MFYQVPFIVLLAVASDLATVAVRLPTFPHIELSQTENILPEKMCIDASLHTGDL